jgi:hypothetical protein
MALTSEQVSAAAGLRRDKIGKRLKRAKLEEYIFARMLDQVTIVVEGWGPRCHFQNAVLGGYI